MAASEDVIRVTAQVSSLSEPWNLIYLSKYINQLDKSVKCLWFWQETRPLCSSDIKTYRFTMWMMSKKCMRWKTGLWGNKQRRRIKNADNFVEFFLAEQRISQKTWILRVAKSWKTKLAIFQAALAKSHTDPFNGNITADCRGYTYIDGSLRLGKPRLKLLPEWIAHPLKFPIATVSWDRKLREKRKRSGYSKWDHLINIRWSFEWFWRISIKLQWHYCSKPKWLSFLSIM